MTETTATIDPPEELARRAALPEHLRCEVYRRPFANAPQLNALSIDQVMGTGPCYQRERIAALWRDHAGGKLELTALEVARGWRAYWQTYWAVRDDVAHPARAGARLGQIRQLVAVLSNGEAA